MKALWVFDSILFSLLVPLLMFISGSIVIIHQEKIRVEGAVETTNDEKDATVVMADMENMRAVRLESINGGRSHSDTSPTREAARYATDAAVGALAAKAATAVHPAAGAAVKAGQTYMQTKRKRS